MSRAAPNAVWLPDCEAGHVEAKSSELAFKLRTRPLPPQLDEQGRVLFHLGQCVACFSCIGFEPEVLNVDRI